MDNIEHRTITITVYDNHSQYALDLCVNFFYLVSSSSCYCLNCTINKKIKRFLWITLSEEQRRSKKIIILYVHKILKKESLLCKRLTNKNLIYTKIAFCISSCCPVFELTSIRLLHEGNHVTYSAILFESYCTSSL